MSDQNPDLERLQQLASLGELAAGVTHETRNLLTGIVGFIQLAKAKNGDPEAGRRHLDVIEREALRAVEILEQFLRLTREDEAAGTHDIDLAQLVGEVAGAVSHLAGMRRAEIVTRVDAASVRARIRRQSLQQILLNLVLNALHATPSTGGRIEVTASTRGGELSLVVADNGAGVPVELREKIFTAFFTTKPRSEGTGLGLAVCRRLVENGGGTITCAESNQGGAAFVARLPAEELA